MHALESPSKSGDVGLFEKVERQRVMHFLEFTIQRQNQVPLHRGWHIRVIKALWRCCARVLFSSFDHSEILLRKQIDDNLIALLSLQRRLYHLDKYGELFEVTRLVCDLFDVLLLVFASPDQSLHLGLNIDDKVSLRIKLTDLEY